MRLVQVLRISNLFYLYQDVSNTLSLFDSWKVENIFQYCMGWPKSPCRTLKIFIQRAVEYNMYISHLCLLNNTWSFVLINPTVYFVISHIWCLFLYSLLLCHSLFDFIVPPFFPIIVPSPLWSNTIYLFPSPLFIIP